MSLDTKLRSLADDLACILAQEIAEIGSANDDGIRRVISETEIDVSDEIRTWMSEHLEDRIDDCCISEQVGDLISTLDGMPCVDDLSVRLDDLEVEQAGTQKDLDKHLLEMPDLDHLTERFRLLELSVIPIVAHLTRLVHDLTDLGLVPDASAFREEEPARHTTAKAFTEATTRAQVTSEIPAEALDEVALDLH